MGAIERKPLPADLVRARSRFQSCRGRRKLGEGIPKPLWALAAWALARFIFPETKRLPAARSSAATLVDSHPTTSGSSHPL